MKIYNRIMLNCIINILIIKIIQKSLITTINTKYIQKTFLILSLLVNYVSFNKPRRVAVLFPILLYIVFNLQDQGRILFSIANLILSTFYKYPRHC